VKLILCNVKCLTQCQAFHCAVGKIPEERTLDIASCERIIYFPSIIVTADPCSSNDCSFLWHQTHLTNYSFSLMK
jgi:hypothetical protein